MFFLLYKSKSYATGNIISKWEFLWKFILDCSRYTSWKFETAVKAAGLHGTDGRKVFVSTSISWRKLKKIEGFVIYNWSKVNPGPLSATESSFLVFTPEFLSFSSLSFTQDAFPFLIPFFSFFPSIFTLALSEPWNSRPGDL